MKPTLIRTFGLLLLAPVLAAQAQTPRIVSLQDAIDAAQLYSPTAIQSRNAIVQSKNGVTDAYAAFLPTASVGAGLNRRTVTTWRGPGPMPSGYDNKLGFSTTLSLQLPSPLDPNMYLNITSAKLSLHQSEIQESQTHFTLKQNVQTQYYQTLRNREQLGAQLRAKAVADTNFQNTLIKYRNGSVAITDSINGYIAVQSADVSVRTAQNTLNNSYLTLQRTIGSQTPIETIASDTGAVQYIPIDSIGLLASIETNPTMQLQDITMETRRIALKKAKLAYIPRISWGLNYSRSGSGAGVFGLGDDYYTYSGTDNKAWQKINFNLSLFSGFGREHTLQQAHLTLDQQQVTYNDQLLNQRQQVLQAIGNLRTAEANLRVLELRVGSADQALKFTQVRYGVGAETQVNLTNSQNTLTDARIALINARYDYRNAVAVLEGLIGRELR